MIIVAIIALCFTAVVAVGGLLAALFRRGMNEGRLTEILSTLQTIVSDHEARIRVLEHAQTTRAKTESGS
jgi:hypothetical protein